MTTLLDYRQGAAEPGVLHIDLDEGGDAPLRKSYDTFDAFFSDPRLEDADRQAGGRASSDRRDRSRLADRGYDAGLPQRFWADDNANVSRGVSDEEWQAAEARLGVSLPAAFRSLYAVLDGGRAGYLFHPRLGVDERGEPGSPFPGRYSEGALLPLSAWVRLTRLSERLSFPEATPYAQLHENPERLAAQQVPPSARMGQRASLLGDTESLAQRLRRSRATALSQRRHHPALSRAGEQIALSNRAALNACLHHLP